MDKQKRKCFLLVTLLLASLTMGLMVTSIAASDGKVSIQHAAIDIDGNPSDWIGTIGTANTYTVDEGEGIWNDTRLDDNGNGSYIYPNGTHEDMLDYAGKYVPGAVPPKVEYQAWIYTGYPHGGCCDLVEFRVTSNDSYLYLMFRLYNMGNKEIATKWGAGYEHFGFGRMVIQVLIDKDRDGTGRTDLNGTLDANANVSSDYGWEVMLWLNSENDTAAHGAGAASFVEVENGTRYYVFPDNTTLVGNADIYPGCIEAKVPTSVIGDPAGQTWRFMVLVGGYDEGHYRDVDSMMSWLPMFRFVGGEDDPGKDPNIVDLVFYNSSHITQQALLGEFGTTGNFTQLDAYLDIKFDETGNVVPWVPLLTIPIALIALVIARKKMPKTEHQ